MTQEFKPNTINIAAEETYSDGEIIFHEGNSGDWIYLVKSGQVELYRVTQGKKVVIDLIGPGAIFGEIAFIDKKPRSASARAVGEVGLGVYDHDFLTREFNKLPSDIRLIIDHLARRLRKVTTVAVNLVGRRTERVHKTLSVEYKTADEFYKAFLSDLGGGGLFIKTDDLLPEHEEVQLKIYLPDQKQPITPKGRVVWLRESEERGIGLQFVDISSNDKIRINAFIRQYGGK